MDSHEKQTPQRFARYAAMLILLLTLGVGQMRAYNEYNKQYLYFNGSSFTSFFNDGCKPYISPKWDYDCNNGSNNGGDKQMMQIGSSYYYYLDLANSSASYASFRGFYIGRGSSFYDGAKMGNVDGSTNNCIKATGWGTYSWEKYSPPMSSATVSNTSTVYGGDGTSGNPYQIKKGTTLSVSASATSSVPGDNQSKYYQFYKKQGSGTRTAWGSESTTNTASVTASSEVGVIYEIDVVARNEFYGTYGTTATSGKVYFITIDPIYAILGGFNEWTHSAATWDLSDQGSNNWDATFSLDEGTYEFKVVHNSVYYGKNSTGTYTTVTRAAYEVTSLESGSGKENLKITVDLAGSYTFRFNSSSKKLTVTYPSYTEALSSMSVDKGTGVFGDDGTTSGKAWKIYTSRISSSNVTMTVSPISSSQGGTIKYAIGSSEKGTVTNPQSISISTINPSTTATSYTFKAYFKKGTYKSTGTEKTVSKYIQKTPDPTVTLTTEIGGSTVYNAELTSPAPTITLQASVTNNLVNANSNFTYYVKVPGSNDWAVVESNTGASTTYTPSAIGTYKFKVKWNHLQDWESSEYNFVMWKNYTIYIWDPDNYAKYVHLWGDSGDKDAWGNASEAMTSNSAAWGTGWYYFTLQYPLYDKYKVHLNNNSSSANAQSVQYTFTQEPDVENNNVYFRCTNKSDANWLISSIEEPQVPEITITEVNVYATKIVVSVTMNKHYSLLTAKSVTINGSTPGGSRTGEITNVGGGTWTYTLTGLTENTDYLFQASATNALGTTSTAKTVTTAAKMPITFTIKVSSNLMKNQSGYWGANGKTSVKVKYFNAAAGFSGTAELTRKTVDAGYWWYQYTFPDSPVSFYVFNANYSDGSGADRSGQWNNAAANGCAEVYDDIGDYGNHNIGSPELCGVHYKLVYNNGTKTTTSNVIGDESDKMSLFIDKYNGGSPAGRSLKIYKFTTSWNSGTEIFSTVNPSESAVYVVSLKEGKSFESASTSDWKFEKYTGNYYIRTDKASGGWNNYKGSSNQMTYSEYSTTLTSDPFSHYFMIWIQGANESERNVKFDVANDYNKSLSFDNAGLGEDAYANGYGQLKQNANVRFMYNNKTNTLSRAYLSGSARQSDLFLVLKGNGSNQLWTIKSDGTRGTNHTTNGTTNWAFFKDNNNWIYQVDVYALPSTYIKLTAQMTNKSGSAATQYFKGDATATWDATHADLLIGGDRPASPAESDYYKMRVIYDFKTNRLMTAWLPSALSHDEALDADVMLIREGQGDAAQVTLNSHDLTNVYTIYSVMQFNRWRLNNRANPENTAVSACAREVSTDNWVYDETVTNTYHPAIAEGAAGWLPKSARDIYWISFPFDVRLSEVFGSVGTYGIQWGIEKYHGDERAMKGFWKDSEGFWKLIPGTNTTLKAFEGYLLVLDLDYFAYNNTTTWASNIQQVELYFPSASSSTNPVSIKTDDETINFDQTNYQCTIDRRSDEDKANNVQNVNKDRRIVDSYWHCMGVPSFHNVSQTYTTGEDPETITSPTAGSYWTPTGKLYYYEWDPSDNSYTVKTSGSPGTFKSMWAYMVQYSGATLSWTNVSKIKPNSIVARKTINRQDYNVQLTLLKGGLEEDQTLMRLTDDEGITNGFEFNFDLCKEHNGGKGNIWTITTDGIPVAGNSMPFSEQTTIVPVGVKIATNGDYTFSIPDGTDGVGVTLIDSETGVHTNLALENYTVTLASGTYEQRFKLEISPIAETPSEIENVSGGEAQDSETRKVMVDGVLYMVKDGRIFDARGARVK